MVTCLGAIDVGRVLRYLYLCSEGLITANRSNARQRRILIGSNAPLDQNLEVWKLEVGHVNVHVCLSFCFKAAVRAGVG